MASKSIYGGKSHITDDGVEYHEPTEPQYADPHAKIHFSETVLSNVQGETFGEFRAFLQSWADKNTLDVDTVEFYKFYDDPDNNYYFELSGWREPTEAEVASINLDNTVRREEYESSLIKWAELEVKAEDDRIAYNEQAEVDRLARYAHLGELVNELVSDPAKAKVVQDQVWGRNIDKIDLLELLVAAQ